MDSLTYNYCCSVFHIKCILFFNDGDDVISNPPHCHFLGNLNLKRFCLTISPATATKSTFQPPLPKH